MPTVRVRLLRDSDYGAAGDVISTTWALAEALIASGHAEPEETTAALEGGPENTMRRGRARPRPRLGGKQP